MRQGAVFADIGTDHAHLPIFLLKQNRIRSAVAADLREGPLSRARENAAQAGVSDKIDFRLANGLAGMESLGLTDIAICGMGGELIASILDNAPFVRNPDIRLILQPMTRAPHLRLYLASNGFAIQDEVVCQAAGRLYICIASTYAGSPYTLSAAEIDCGQALLRRKPNVLERAFIEERLDAARRRLDGRTAGGIQDAETNTLSFIIDTYERYLEVNPA